MYAVRAASSALLSPIMSLVLQGPCSSTQYLELWENLLLPSLLLLLLLVLRLGNFLEQKRFASALTDFGASFQ
eukprot:1698372-Amphidinium_carterae.1